MKKSKIITAIVALVLSILSFSLIPATTHAISSICDQEGVSEEVKKANGCEGDVGTDLKNVIIGIINGVVGVLALVAVIFIVVGAVNYMTSQGDSGKLQKAKSTILYALIGLIIAVLSFAIVNFVIAKIINNEPDTDTTITTVTTPLNGRSDSDPDDDETITPDTDPDE